jgi:HTH-type transcriptional regulator/antitoxin HigA
MRGFFRAAGTIPALSFPLARARYFNNQKKRNLRKVEIGGCNSPCYRYPEMVRESPLRVIHSEQEYQRAIAMLDRLSDRGDGRTVDETEYLVALAVFVGKYEEEHHAIPQVSGVDMLRYLIETHQKTRRDVAAGTGLADSTISEILAGTRKVTVKQFETLARFFKVKAAVFIDVR